MRSERVAAALAALLLGCTELKPAGDRRDAGDAAAPQDALVDRADATPTDADPPRDAADVEDATLDADDATTTDADDVPAGEVATDAANADPPADADDGAVE